MFADWVPGWQLLVLRVLLLVLLALLLLALVLVLVLLVLLLLALVLLVLRVLLLALVLALVLVPPKPRAGWPPGRLVFADWAPGWQLRLRALLVLVPEWMPEWLVPGSRGALR